MNYQELSEKYARHVNPEFIKLLGSFGYGRHLTKTEGVWVWDENDKKYLDIIAAYGSNNLGHFHPRISKKILEFLHEKPYCFLHFAPSKSQALLAEKLSQKLGRAFRYSLFSSSGSEGVEAAMKLAALYTGRSKFLAAENGYHGTGIGALSLMGRKRLWYPFKNILMESHKVPFGDLKALEAALKGETVAAYIVEPVQGEGGGYFPPENYLDEARELCHRYGTLFVIDEVQTGFGRLGRWFGFETMVSSPDIVVLAKSLGGGIAPIAATVTTEKIFLKAYGDKERYDLHGSTFGGNALSCEVAMEAINILEEEDIIKNAKEQGDYLLLKLKEKLKDHPFISDVRGEGLFLAIEMGSPKKSLLDKIITLPLEKVSELVLGQWICYCLLEEGILIQPSTHYWNIVKIKPPLIINREEVDFLIDKISKVFWEYDSFATFAKDIYLKLKENK